MLYIFDSLPSIQKIQSTHNKIIQKIQMALEFQIKTVTTPEANTTTSSGIINLLYIYKPTVNDKFFLN